MQEAIERKLARARVAANEAIDAIEDAWATAAQESRISLFGRLDDARESARRLRDSLAVDFGAQRAAPASVAQINAQVAQASAAVGGGALSEARDG